MITMLWLLLLSAFWPKYLSGRKALWYFFHGTSWVVCCFFGKAKTCLKKKDENV